MSDKVTISDQRAFLIATMLRDQAEVLDERAESEHSAFALETVKRAASCRNMADDLEAAALAPAPAASSGAEAGDALPADLAPMLTAVIEAGPAKWQCTEAMTAEQHGEEFARMVRETAERYGLGDEPHALHWLGVAGDRSLAFVGTSPHSPHLARALTGAWNRLVDEAPDLLASLAPAPAGAE